MTRSSRDYSSFIQTSFLRKLLVALSITATVMIYGNIIKEVSASSAEIVNDYGYQYDEEPAYSNYLGETGYNEDDENVEEDDLYDLSPEDYEGTIDSMIS